MTRDPQQIAVRIGALIITNALIFQEQLASSRPKVRTLASVQSEPTIQPELIDAWDEILEIDYYPIFWVAREVLASLPSDSSIDKALRQLTRNAQKIVSRRAALRHDLMGRVYHRLLREAKYLGTYYTSVPAATLLLKLALKPSLWPSVAWEDPESIRDLRIGDLACGTGTLLMAAVQAVADNHVHAAASQGKSIKADQVHAALIEEVLHGFDVLAAAVHLTASTLAMLSPAVVFDKMHLYVMPHGGDKKRLGSLEFLEGSKVTMQLDLFGAGGGEAEEVRGSGQDATAAEAPELDLCVMNPPFTRSVGGNLLFGTSPAAERKEMQKKLRGILRRHDVSASTTAGLGSVFTALGDRVLKEDGRQALVLPKALLSGVAWGKTRELLASSYVGEFVIASHEPDHWNFSENTSLSETLAILRKVTAFDGSEETVWINLFKVPQTSVQATALADAIQRTNPAPIDGPGTASIKLGGETWGHVVKSKWADIKDGQWYLCQFAQTDLLRTCHKLLTKDELDIPSKGTSSLKLRPLGELGDLGPDVRDIHDGFDYDDSTASPYPVVWGHKSDHVRTLKQSPTGHLHPLSAAKPGRPLRKASVLWPRAGQLLVAERLRLDSQRMSAVFLDEKVLAGSWWPVRLRAQDQKEAAKILALWLNSSLGIMMAMAHREDTEGAWGKYKKPMLEAMPVIDVDALTQQQRKELVEVADDLAASEFQAISELGSDKTRAELDRRIARAMGWPDVNVIRDLLAQEPILSGVGLGAAGP